MAVEQGESSVALLILWEADHGKAYPFRAVDLIGRLPTFRKARKGAVAVTVHTELSAWPTCKMMRMQLSTSLPYSSLTRWAVSIDSAACEPFLSIWKNFLVGLLCQHQSVASAADPGPPQKRPKWEIKRRPRKRPKEGLVPPPPASTKKARIERLRAAMTAAVAAGANPSSSFSSSTDTSRPAQYGVASYAGSAWTGAIT